MSKKTFRILTVILSVLLGALVLLIVLMASCQNERELPPELSPTPDVIRETPGPTPDIVEVESISILLESNEIFNGSRFQPEVIIYPENATHKIFDIYSENEDIVRPHGRFWLAAGVGTTNIIVKASNGVIGSVTITVIPAIESVSFERDELTMNVGDTIRLTPITVPRDAILDFPATFKSGNTDVAVVMEDGTVIASRAGTAVIECTVGDVTATVRITVVNAVRQISINLDRRFFRTGERVEFSVQIQPETASNQEYTVTYRGATVTPGSNNSFTTVSGGDVTITATAANGVTGSVTVMVHDLSAYADEVLRLTNIERANAGLAPLVRMQVLVRAADIRANEIITSFSHTRPDGREFGTVLSDVGYNLAAENLASGQTTPAEAVQAWMDSPGHREAILETDFSSLGVGVAMDNNGKLFWTQIFIG
jgi:uncharacterized protein YkwD/plastocyanin